MAYIGKQPAIGNFVKLDAISVVNGQAAYTMQNGGANFTEYSNVNQFLVSLNGILQSPTDSFTVSGSTITFASNLITGDVIDFIIVLGNSLDVGVPSDNTVSLAKLTATGTKDATTFLRGDNTFAEAGKVLQAQTFVTTGNSTSTTSTTYTDTVSSINITPLSSNSKILVFADHGVAISAGAVQTRIDIRIHETTTSTSVTDKKYIGNDGTAVASVNCQIGLSGGFTNSSTAQKTFKVQVRKANGNVNESGSIYLNWYNNALHTMMAIEVQA
jgi:hypothetical protein